MPVAIMPRGGKRKRPFFIVLPHFSQPHTIMSSKGHKKQNVSWWISLNTPPPQARDRQPESHQQQSPISVLLRSSRKRKHVSDSEQSRAGVTHECLGVS